MVDAMRETVWTHGYNNLLGYLLGHHPTQCMDAREYLSKVLTRLTIFNLWNTCRRLGRKIAEQTDCVAVAAVKKVYKGQRVDLNSSK